MKHLFKLFSILFFLVLAFNITSCKKLSSYDMPPSAVSIYEIINEDDYNFSYFKTAVDLAGFSDLLKGGNYTIFAPTNNSFLAAGYNISAIQEMSIDSLNILVKNHLVEGKIDIQAISADQEITTLSGNKIRLQKIGEATYVNGADITNANEIATNGVMNVINKLLISRTSILDRIDNYQTTTTKSKFTFLMAAFARASEGSTNFISMLNDPSAEYTLFAPNDGAFMDAGYTTLSQIAAADPDTLGMILNNHLLSGKKLISDFDSLSQLKSISNVPIYFDRMKPERTTLTYANGIGVIGGSVNMFGGKGVVHAVSRFLPVPISTNTLDRIKSDTSLTFFYAALVKAGEAGEMDFIKMLSDPATSYTVFAVTNDGFRNEGYADTAAINEESPVYLTKILKFGMLYKRINNINIPESATAATLLTEDDELQTPDYLTFTFVGGYHVKGPSNEHMVPVIEGNVVTTNGLLNIIGSILKP